MHACGGCAVACGGARSALRRRVSGGWAGGTPCAPGGRWSAVCDARVRGEILRGAQAPTAIHEEKGWEVRNLVTFESRVRTIGTQSVNRWNAVFRTGSRPVARDGSDRAVESGRPPTGGPVRSDRKEHRSSQVTTVRRTYVPLREERSSSFRNRNGPARPSAVGRTRPPGHFREGACAAGAGVARGDMN